MLKKKNRLLKPLKCKICAEDIPVTKMEKHSLNCLRRKACYEKIEELNRQLFANANQIEKFKTALINPNRRFLEEAKIKNEEKSLIIRLESLNSTQYPRNLNFMENPIPTISVMNTENKTNIIWERNSSNSSKNDSLSVKESSISSEKTESKNRESLSTNKSDEANFPKARRNTGRFKEIVNPTSQLTPNILQTNQNSPFRRNTSFSPAKLKSEAQNLQIPTANINLSPRKSVADLRKKQIEMRKSAIQNLNNQNFQEFKNRLENLSLLSEYTTELSLSPYEENFDNDEMMSVWLDVALDKKTEYFSSKKNSMEEISFIKKSVKSEPSDEEYYKLCEDFCILVRERLKILHLMKVNFY